MNVTSALINFGSENSKNLMKTIALGMFAAIVLIMSICCLYYKKSFLGFVGSIVTIALTCCTGYSWKIMLINSGKDTTLLGFNRYPAALIILAILLLTAIILLIESIIWIVRQNKSKG